MNKKTKEALLESIEHWEQNLNMLLLNYLSEEVYLWRDISTSGCDCALCQMFTINDENYCEGCPVYNKTQSHSCNESPYEKIRDIKCSDKFADVAYNYQESYEAFAAELEFLYSLLESD